MEKFKNWISLDLRVISLIRIIFALLFFFELFIRFFDKDFYSYLLFCDVNFLTNPHLFFINSNILLWVHLVLLFVFSIFLLIGYNSNKFLVLIFILYFSFINKFSIVSTYGNEMLLWLMFLLIFIPLDNFYSIKKTNKTQSFYPVISLYLMIIAIYLVNFYFKGAIWKIEGNALSDIFQNKIIANDFSSFLLNFPIFLKVSTYFFVYWELIGSLLFIFGFLFLKKTSRNFIVLLFIFCHIFIFATVKLTIFPMINIVFWSLFFVSSNQKFDFNPIKQKIPIVVLIFSFVYSFMVLLNITSYRNNVFLHDWLMFAPAPIKNEYKIEYYVANKLLSSELEKKYNINILESTNEYRTSIYFNFAKSHRFGLVLLQRHLCRFDENKGKNIDIVLYQKHNNQLILIEKNKGQCN